jgi:hypothetical protein
MAFSATRKRNLFMTLAKWTMTAIKEEGSEVLAEVALIPLTSSGCSWVEEWAAWEEWVEEWAEEWAAWEVATKSSHSGSAETFIKSIHQSTNHFAFVYIFSPFTP